MCELEGIGKPCHTHARRQSFGFRQLHMDLRDPPREEGSIGSGCLPPMTMPVVVFLSKQLASLPQIIGTPGTSTQIAVRDPKAESLGHIPTSLALRQHIVQLTNTFCWPTVPLRCCFRPLQALCLMMGARWPGKMAGMEGTSSIRLWERARRAVRGSPPRWCRRDGPRPWPSSCIHSCCGRWRRPGADCRVDESPKVAGSLLLLILIAV